MNTSNRSILCSVVLPLLYLFVLLSQTLFAQEKIILNHADSLIGKSINGEQVREAIGMFPYRRAM